jgi:hypothetical protein
VLLVIGVTLVVTLVVLWRHGGRELRALALIAVLALVLRIGAIAIIFSITSPVHGEGVWLNDEASYFLATEALMPWPWDRALPEGLGHLGGNGYLGLTSVLSQATGVVDAQALRLANSALGTLVVLLCAWTAHLLFGRKAGLVAGVAAAVSPNLVLWSATMLRDTLCSFAVMSIWWVLLSYGRERWRAAACFVLLGLVLLDTLRPYLAVTVGVGVVAWLVWPVIQGLRPRFLLSGAGALVLGVAAIGLVQQQRLDEMTHELFYRQTVTRMETLGRLYRDPAPTDDQIQQPYRPGAAIALVDPQTGWLLPGLVEDSAMPGQVNVGLTDDTSRSVPLDDNLVLLQDARIPPLEFFVWVLPSLLSVFAGLPTTSDPPSLVWIGSALLWDVLLVAAVLGVWRGRLAVRSWIYPLCLIGGTVIALSAIPGAPGNAERHRATQTLPLLLVLASGLVSSRRRDARQAERPVASATSMPTSAMTAVPSSRRSLR